MKIAVFVQGFPVFSETFVLNELLELQKQGVTGTIWHETDGDRYATQPSTKKLIFTKKKLPEKIFGKELTSLLTAHLYWLFNSPLSYFKATAILFNFFSVEHLRIFLKVMLTAKEMEPENYDLLYVHEADSAFLYAKISSVFLKKPVGIIFHTYYLFHKQEFLKCKIKLADFIVLQSEFSLQYLRHKLLINTKALKKVHVISVPGIDLDFFKPSLKKYDPSLKIKVLSVGRIEEAKGFLYLIQAVSALKKKRLAISCKIVGEGSLRRQLQLLINKLDLTDEITLIGAVPHSPKLLQLYAEANLFILPSVVDHDHVHDVHPNVIKEAMAMKMLTITTELGGIREVIQEDVNGFLVHPGNAEELATKIEHVNRLSNFKKNKVRENARKTIQQQFEISATIKKLIDVFTLAEYR